MTNGINSNELINLKCENCGTENLIKISRVHLNPNCGKCNSLLKINEDIIEDKLKSYYSKIDDLDNIFFKDLSHYIQKYLSENEYREISRKISGLIDSKNKLEKKQIPITMVVAGEFSSGKSYVINSLIGENLIPTGPEPMTLAASFFKYGINTEIYIEFTDNNIKPITKQEFESIKHTNKNNLPKEYNNIKFIHFFYPYERLKAINIIDTPGFSTSTEKMDDEKTIYIIKKYSDVLLWIFNAVHGTVPDSEKTIFERVKILLGYKKNDDSFSSYSKAIKESKVPIIGLVNQIDLKGSPESSDVKKILENVKNESNLEVLIPYSAKKILDIKTESFESSINKIIEEGLSEEKDLSLNIRFKTNEFGKKRIIIETNSNLLLDKPYVNEKVWLQKFDDLEKELDILRKKSKQILINTMFNEVEKLSDDLMVKINNIKKLSLEREKKFIKHTEDAINELEMIKKNLGQVYKNCALDFNRNIRKKIPAMIFSIEPYSSYYHLKLNNNILNVNLIQIQKEVTNCFNFESSYKNDLSFINDVFSKLESKILAIEKSEYDIKDGLKTIMSARNSINNSLEKGFKYNYYSVVELLTIFLAQKAKQVYESDKTLNLDTKITSDHWLEIYFDKVFDFNTSNIFSGLENLVDSCYKDLIVYLKQVIRQVQNQKSETNYLDKLLKKIEAKR